MNSTLQHRTPHSGRLSAAPYHTAPDQRVGRDWQIAQERVLLYLRTLEIPAQEALEVGLQALRRAEKSSSETAAENPAATAMHALRDILSERTPNLLGRPAGWLPAGGDPRIPGIKLMPPLNRGSMVVEKLGQRSWITFVPRCLRQPAEAFRRFIASTFFYLMLALSVFIIVALHT